MAPTKFLLRFILVCKVKFYPKPNTKRARARSLKALEPYLGYDQETQDEAMEISEVLRKFSNVATAHERVL